MFLSALLFLYLHLSTHCTQAGVQRAVVYCAVSFTPVVVWTLSMAQGLFSYASAPRSCISATPYNGALWSMLCEKTNITFALYMITCSSIALCAAHVAPTDRSRGDHVDSDSDILSYVVTAAVTSNDALTAAPAAATTTAGDSCVDTEGTSAEQTPRAEVPVPDKSVQAVLALMLLIILSGSFAHNFALGLLCSVQLVPSLIIVIQGTTGTVAGRAARFGSSRQRNFWSVLVLGAIVLLHVVNIR